MITGIGRKIDVFHKRVGPFLVFGSIYFVGFLAENVITQKW